MLSKYQDKLEAIRDIGLSIGTQVLHMHHIMHGLDPITIRKADMITAYLKFVWDNHSFDDFHHFAPDLVINRINSANVRMSRYSKDTNEIIQSLVDSATSGLNKEEVERFNHDYELAIDAIEKISSGHIEDINVEALREAAEYIDYSELPAASSEEDDLSSIQKELHECAIEEFEKRKAFEQRIYIASRSLHNK